MTSRITRRGLLGGVAGLAMVGALGACSGSDDTSGSSSGGAGANAGKTGAMDGYAVGKQFKATEPLEFTTLYSDHPNYPYKADWLLWSEITKRTNVTLKPTLVPMSDYAQKRSLLVSAGDAPMIIPKTYPGQESAYVSSGAILPVSDYTDLMPNFTKKVTDWKMDPELKSLRQADGKYYVLPGLHEELWPDYTLIARLDVLKDNGIAEPTSWDEVYEACKKLKAKYPNITPINDRYQGNNLLGICGTAYGTTAGWAYGSGVTFNKEKDAYEFSAATSAYKDLVTFLNKMVSEGLLDPNSFTQQDDPAITAFTTGKSFFISGNSQDPPSHRALMDKNIGVGKYEIGKIILPSGPAGKVMGGTRLENGIMISSKAKDDPKFTAMMQFIDWLWYSDEGEEFARWGVQGTTYTKTNGKRTLAKDVNYMGLNPAGTKKLNADFGFANGVFAYGGTTDLIQSMMRPEELTWQKRMAAERTPVAIPPAFPFTDDQREQATMLTTPLTDEVNSNTLKFITGQRKMTEWDSFVQGLESKGVSTYVDLVNKAYQAAKNK